jgi:hypothetical protein
VNDIDNGRMVLWLRQGKGAKDRAVPLLPVNAYLLEKRNDTITVSFSCRDMWLPSQIHQIKGCLGMTIGASPRINFRSRTSPSFNLVRLMR